MEDQRGVKTPGREPTLEDDTQRAFEGEDAAIAGLRVLRVEP
jgi:hypothetical protein